MKFDLFRSRQGEQGFQIEDKQNADLAGHFPQNLFVLFRLALTNVS